MTKNPFTLCSFTCNIRRTVISALNAARHVGETEASSLQWLMGLMWLWVALLSQIKGHRRDGSGQADFTPRQHPVCVRETHLSRSDSLPSRTVHNSGRRKTHWQVEMRVNGSPQGKGIETRDGILIYKAENTAWNVLKLELGDIMDFTKWIKPAPSMPGMIFVAEEVFVAVET